ncbi:hypothetical protein LZY01_19990 [Levilactobacillus zymae]|uniref:LytTR family transcriptional regulator n=1 Tax=Levilactobacillus zymae TaxID=267363 RepID=A0ABQ0X0Q7_9LACO|nr:hypothetical protein LZY01_19990 [Levilactobacillus zymae]
MGHIQRVDKNATKWLVNEPKWVHLGTVLINLNNIAFVQDRGDENGITVYLIDGRRLDVSGRSLKDFEESLG